MNNLFVSLIEKIRRCCGKSIKQAGDVINARPEDLVETKSIEFVEGGGELKNYLISLQISYHNGDDLVDADNTEFHSYTYEAENGDITDDLIDEAVQDFFEQFSDYDQTKLRYLGHSHAHTREGTGFTLEDMRLLNSKRLCDKLFDDDIKTNHTKDECVIDGLLAFLRTWKKVKREDLIRQLGTTTPTLRQIKAWHASLDWNYGQYASLYVVDAFLNDVFHAKAREYSKVMITFALNEEHLYPITDQAMRNQLQHHQAIRLDRQQVKLCSIAKNFDYIADPDASSGFGDKPFQLVETDDLSWHIKHLRTVVHDIAFNRSKVAMFRHPETEQLIISAPEYRQRQQVADVMYAQTPYVGFRFTNQSYCELAKTFFRVRFGTLPLEKYGPHQLDLFERWTAKPYIATVGPNMRNFPEYSIDVRNCYPSITITNQEDYPVLHYRDQPERFEPSTNELVAGYYFIRKFVLMSNGAQYGHGWRTLPFVKYCLMMNYITKADITHVMKATGYLPADTLKGFTELVFKTFPREQAKTLANYYYGWLGRRSYKRTQGALTTSFKTAMATHLHYQYKDRSVRVYPTPDETLYFMRRETFKQKYEGHASIHRQIVESSYVLLDQMYRTITDNGRIPNFVLGFTSDSIKIAMKEPPIGVKTNKDDCAFGDYHVEKQCDVRGKMVSEVMEPYYGKAIKPIRKWKNITKDEMTLNQSILVYGAPGTGKSTRIHADVAQFMDQGKKFIILSYTRASCENLMKDNPTLKPYVRTFDSYFHDKKGLEKSIADAMKLDVIIVEEWGAVPERFYHWLYQVKRGNPDIVIRMFGDNEQCRPPDKVQVNYMKCCLVKVLVNHQRCEFPYIEGTSRYEATLAESLNVLKATGRLNETIRSRGWLTTPFSMCKTGKMRAEVNAREADKWLEANPDLERYRLGKRTFVEGMPIISVWNDAKGKVSNSNEFTFVSATDETVVLQKVNDKSLCEVAMDQFIGFNEDNKTVPNFRYGFCETVFRKQGLTIRYPCNLLEGDKMSRQDMKSALGRFTDVRHIGLRMTNALRYFRWQEPSTKQILYELTKPTINAEPALIYEIYETVAPSGHEYRGYTTTSLEQRFTGHHEDPTSAKMGTWLTTTKTDIRLLDSVFYIGIDEVLTIETAYIQLVPDDRSMNSIQRRKPKKPDKGKFQLVFGEPEVKPRKRPKPQDQAKYKRYRYQVSLDGQSEYFPYKKNDHASKVLAHLQAEDYINRHSY